MTIKKTTIPSTKGKLAAAIHYSESKTDKLAILCPGFLDSKDYLGLVGLAEELAGRDYMVVRFDPTGTWESEGDSSDYNNTQYLIDIKSVLEYMLGLDSYQHILLGGHSRGGQLSILYAARDPRISMVLGIMPSSDHSLAGKRREDWQKNGVSISNRDLPDKSGTIEYRVPYSHVVDREKYDVVEDVKKITAPIILLAGELDKLVLPEHVKEIYDNANEPKKLIIVPGIGHDYRHRENEVKVVNKIILEQLD
ncbi:MAG: alpha/beta hydrolase [bacterium]